jgi:hypothetical protein
MYFLTLTQGQQMLGFSLAHIAPWLLGLVFISAVAFLALAVFAVVLQVLRLMKGLEPLARYASFMLVVLCVQVVHGVLLVTYDRWAAALFRWRRHITNRWTGATGSEFRIIIGRRSCSVTPWPGQLNRSMLSWLTEMRVVNHANLSDETVADIAAELSGQENLKDVMSWALSSRPGVFIPSVVAEVIVQDEFTHDVVVPWRDSLVLVYDTTWLGGVTAVAVWDHRPTADEILEARLNAGWTPRPTLLQAGDRVVGHAACAVTNVSP